MIPTPHYIVGHKIPDTDAMVSAHVLAWLHHQLNPDSNATALRLGNANKQTDWLFTQTSTELPLFRESCLYLASEIARPTPIVTPDTPLRQALELMQRFQTEFAAVVDNQQRPIGIVSNRTPRTNYLLQCNVEDFFDTLLDFSHLVTGLPLSLIQQGKTSTVKSLFVPLSSHHSHEIWNHEAALIIGDRESLLHSIAQTPPAAIILTGVSIQRAHQIAEKIHDCSIYHFSGSIISMLTRLPGCFPASAAIEESFPSVDEDANLNQISRKIRDSLFGLAVLNTEGQIIGSISPLDILKLKDPKISLVDHSEKAQSIHGLDDAEVIEIIDHHRLGDVETIHPLAIDVRPEGSTASILFDRINNAKIKIPPNIAKLLLGALIADTLLLSSPTCTELDKQRALQLAALAQVNLESFGYEVLKQNDELATASPQALVTRDSKVFKYQNFHFVAAQIETVDLNTLSANKARLLSAAFLNDVNIHRAQFGVLMVTDVIKKCSHIIIVSNDPIWLNRLVPESCDDPQLWIIDQFVSRKKQLIPMIMQTLRSIH